MEQIRTAKRLREIDPHHEVTMEPCAIVSRVISRV